jgi:ATP-dependent DNA helicase RecQ
MENSAQQLTNVLDAFELRGSVPDGPVLLIDDVVDSRWTLTVVGSLLLEAGSGPAFPFVLAEAVGT